MMTEKDYEFMLRAIELAEQGMDGNDGGPFGAVIVNAEGEIVGEGNNKVTSTNDPTAHAEVVAIRNACENLGTFQLTGCTIYTSCEPCPMCLGAIYWARPEKILYACSREDAAAIGFDDEFIYQEIPKEAEDRQIPTIQMLQEKAVRVFQKWQSREDKTEY